MLSVNSLEQIIDDAKHNSVYIEMGRQGIFYRPRMVNILNIGVKLKLIKIETIKYAHRSEITKVSLTEAYKKLLDAKDRVD